jgi:hypothetical protein
MQSIKPLAEPTTVVHDLDEEMKRRKKEDEEEEEEEGEKKWVVISMPLKPCCRDPAVICDVLLVKMST